MEPVLRSLWEENELSCDLLDQAEAPDAGPLCGAALGFFDGVHRGHQELLNALLHHCRRLSLEPVVFSFYRMPEKETFDSAERQYKGLIQTPDQRAEFLASYGITRTYLQLFNDRFKSLSAEDFLQKVLYEELGIRLIVSGENFRFGKDRAGDADFLRAWGQKNGVEVVIVPNVISNKEVISSSRIKNAIIKGDFRDVSRLLGHDFSLSGHVIHGNALARTAGMPTANVPVPEGQLCPPYGVYITRTRIGDRFYPSVSNIGTRPTVNKDNFIPLLETYILGVDMDLYGQEIEVYFLSYIRPELKFSSFLSMTAKIQEDIAQAKEWHRSQEELILVSRYNRIPVYTLAAKRFNTAIINIVIKDRLDPVRASANALAARLLMTASRRYPTRTSLQLAADNLYGASLGLHVGRQGDLQVMTFSAEGIRHALDGSEPFAGIVKILLDQIRNPLLDERGLFDAELFRTEQRNLISELKARRQDRDWYALNEAVSRVAAGDPQSISAQGDMDRIANLTRTEVTNAWKRLIEDAQIEIFLAGDLKESLVAEVADYTASLPHNETRLRLVPGVEPSPYELEIKPAEMEYRDIEQTRLVILYKGLPPYNFNQQAAVSVLNSMLGGDVHSLLFNTVREDNGLAYHISSTPLRFLNCLVVQTGINASDLAEVRSLINSCLEDMKLGRTAPETFRTSMKLLRSDLLSISDNLGAMLYFHMDNLACGYRQTMSEALDDLERVTPRHVQELAGRLEEAFSFVLQPEENKAEADGVPEELLASHPVRSGLSEAREEEER